MKPHDRKLLSYRLWVPYHVKQVSRQLGQKTQRDVRVHLHRDRGGPLADGLRVESKLCWTYYRSEDVPSHDHK